MAENKSQWQMAYSRWLREWNPGFFEPSAMCPLLFPAIRHTLFALVRPRFTNDERRVVRRHRSNIGERCSRKSPR